MSPQPACSSRRPVLSDDVLHMIFRFLYPPIPPTLSFVVVDIVRRMKAVQNAAAVCSQWRQAALPLLCRTVLVRIDVNEHAALTPPGRGRRLKSASSRKSVTVLSNLNMFLSNNQPRDDLARELIILTYGPSPPPPMLMRCLKSTGLLQTAWLGIERLRIHMQTRDLYVSDGDYSKDAVRKLNSALAIALPMLQEIHFSDLYSSSIYGAYLPVNMLINELIDGPRLTRFLNVYSDTAPVLRRHKKDTPIDISHLYINGVFPKPIQALLCKRSDYPCRFVADSLVKLGLSFVSPKGLWEMFVPKQPYSPNNLVFTQLQSLDLAFYWHIERGPTIRNAIMFDTDDTDTDTDDSDGDFALSSRATRDESDYRYYEGASEPPEYMISSTHGVPLFPELRKLDLRCFPGNLRRFLSLFESCPIDQLVLVSHKRQIPPDLDLSSFSKVRSLDLRFVGAFSVFEDGDYAINILKRIFTTSLPNLQRLVLCMDITGLAHFHFPYDTATFAHHLQYLSLNVEIDVNSIALLLLQFSSLQEFYIETCVVNPVASIAWIVQQLRNDGVPNTANNTALPAHWTPVNRSLRKLHVSAVNGMTHFVQSNRPGAGQQLDQASLSSLYRGLLYSLICRLPNLRILCLAKEAVPCLKKDIKTLSSLKVCSKQSTGHLANIKVLPMSQKEL
ncbi:hypothetical protein BX070DRAFT_226572 [Coemansia spiralis]|nr:hypothetical protein BX070DRAFT_226572 [Coemansia spiralis]